MSITGITDFTQTNTCSDFFETHVKGTVSFGMIQNISSSAYQTFDQQLSKSEYKVYGVRPTENQWTVGASYTSSAIDLSKS